MHGPEQIAVWNITQFQNKLGKNEVIPCNVQKDEKLIAIMMTLQSAP
jgi:hypothetical protein